MATEKKLIPTELVVEDFGTDIIFKNTEKSVESYETVTRNYFIRNLLPVILEEDAEKILIKEGKHQLNKNQIITRVTGSITKGLKICADDDQEKIIAIMPPLTDLSVVHLKENEYTPHLTTKLKLAVDKRETIPVAYRKETEIITGSLELEDSGAYKHIEAKWATFFKDIGISSKKVAKGTAKTSSNEQVEYLEDEEEEL